MAEENENDSASKETHVHRATREVNDFVHLWKRKPAIAIVVVFILLAGGMIWVAAKLELFKKEKASHDEKPNLSLAEASGQVPPTTNDHSASPSAGTTTTVNVTQNSGTVIGSVGSMTLQQYSGPPPKVELMPDDVHKALDDVFVSILNVDTAYGSTGWKKLPMCNIPSDESVRDVEAKWTKVRQSTSVHWDAFKNETACMDLAFSGYHACAYAFQDSMHAMELKFSKKPPPPFDNSAYIASRSLQNLTNLISNVILNTGITDTNEPLIREERFLAHFPSSTNDGYYAVIGGSSMMVARQALHYAQEGFQSKLNK